MHKPEKRNSRREKSCFSAKTPGMLVSDKHRTDKDISGGGYSGEMVNRDNIGKLMDELVALWNEKHPDDLIEA